MECTLAANQQACTCPATSCPRHGKCCECVAYHRSKGQLVGCQMPDELRGSSRSPQDLADWLDAQA